MFLINRLQDWCYRLVAAFATSDFAILRACKSHQRCVVLASDANNREAWGEHTIHSSDGIACV
jgi:hypothetical protein